MGCSVCNTCVDVTRATVNLCIDNNATWTDAFQFDDPATLTWSFTGQHFRVDVKGSKDDPAPLLTLTDANGRIVVDDVTQRVLHFNVDEAALSAALLPGTYVYELVMFDNSVPAVRIPLMGGTVTVNQGVTGG